MLELVNWASAVKEEDESDDKPANKCVLVWLGCVAKLSSINLLFTSA